MPTPMNDRRCMLQQRNGRRRLLSQSSHAAAPLFFGMLQQHFGRFFAHFSKTNDPNNNQRAPDRPS